MNYFAEPTHIENDIWFDENIEQLVLLDYLDKKEFNNSVHEKFHIISP